MARRVDYRFIKKVLNRYHRFSFGMPRYGKDFTSRQKSAITRVYDRLQPVLKRMYKDEATFLLKPKGHTVRHIPHIAHTNKGIFVPYSNAKLSKRKDDRKLAVKVDYKMMYELYFAFPLNILGNITKIDKFIQKLIKKYKPDSTLFSINGYQSNQIVDVAMFEHYITELRENKEFRKDMRDAKKSDKNFLEGVFLIFKKGKRFKIHKD